MVTAVAIYKLIGNGAFGPDEIEVMKAAYEAALVDVGVTDDHRAYCKVDCQRDSERRARPEAGDGTRIECVRHS